MRQNIQISLDGDDLDAVNRIAERQRMDLASMVELYLRSLARKEKTSYLSENLAGCLSGLSNLSDAELKNDYLKGKHGV